MSETENKLVKAVKEKGKSLETEMSFFDHLDALRKHLIRASLVILTFMGVAFAYYDFIFDKIIMGPKSPDFWTYRTMCMLAEKFNMGADFCITKIPFDIINTEMAGQFTYLLFEVWLFVKPALHEKERKSANGFTFFATMLFLIGIMFGYYIIAPLSISFLADYNVSDVINNMITIDSYLSTVATLTIGSGVIFELPIIIYILSKLGVMTPKFMRSSRRYATVIILIIAAIVTPTPDLLTMLTVSFPLFLLYEVSIYISASVEKRKLKAELEFDKGIVK
jgi:sec-independent protein translocase protein TatC